jgi:hypothetical protein
MHCAILASAASLLGTHYIETGFTGILLPANSRYDRTNPESGTVGVIILEVPCTCSTLSCTSWWEEAVCAAAGGNIPACMVYPSTASTVSKYRQTASMVSASMVSHHREMTHSVPGYLSVLGYQAISLYWDTRLFLCAGVPGYFSVLEYQALTAGFT